MVSSSILDARYCVREGAGRVIGQAERAFPVARPKFLGVFAALSGGQYPAALRKGPKTTIKDAVLSAPVERQISKRRGICGKKHDAANRNARCAVPCGQKARVLKDLGAVSQCQRLLCARVGPQSEKGIYALKQKPDLG
jgi:hypothetical protein